MAGPMVVRIRRNRGEVNAHSGEVYLFVAVHVRYVFLFGAYETLRL